MKTKRNDTSYSSLADKPCTSKDNDAFNAKERIVDRIYSFITDHSITPLTIAITGEWGCGKSSVINWLKDKVKKNDKKAIVISFEPLLEGKLELRDIIELFYLQLHEQVKNPKLKNTIKKSIQSLVLLSRFKASAGICVPGLGNVGIEKDFGKDVDDLIRIWDNQEFKPFSEQAEKINGYLTKQSQKLYVVVDEIDRLTSEQIINFLLFTRLLELFNNLVCIVSFDYAQVLQKLISEKYLGLCDHNSAKSYIDKLFQCNFYIHHNETKKIEFAQNLLKIVDNDRILQNVISLDNYDTYEQIREITNYLSTPRNIKKWVISVKKNYCITKYSPDKLALLKFLAAIIVHPLLFENYSKHFVQMIHESNITLRGCFSKKYDILIGIIEKIDEIDLRLVTLGLIDRKKQSKQPQLKEAYDACLSVKLFEQTSQLLEFSKSFLNGVPDYLKILLAEGYFDEKIVAGYHNFTGNKIDSTLKVLEKHSSSTDILASDLAKFITETSPRLQTMPTLSLLNSLWREKCQESLYNPYYIVVMFCLKQFESFQTIIDEVDLSMSENLLTSCLSAFGVKNENCKYDMEKFVINNQSQKPLFSKINSKQEMLNNLKRWINKVKKELANENSDWFKQQWLMSVFYRFIQFGNIFNEDYRIELANMLRGWISKKTISIESKCTIIELITLECDKYETNLFNEGKHMPPIESLFNNDSDFIKAIKGFSKKHQVKYMDSFDKLTNALD